MDDIVVGIDGSDRAAAALRWAVAEGRLRDLRVTALLAWSMLEQHHADTSVEFDPDYSEEAATAALEAFVADALGDLADEDEGTGIDLVAICERPATALLDAARGAALVVVGPRGLGGFRGLLLGSVSQQILHHAPCPIVVVRTDDVGPDVASVDRRRIVVGVDGSTSSRHALSWALDEARARGCAVEVVHTWLPPYAYGYPVPIPLDVDAAEAHAQSMLDEVIAAADTTGLPAPVETVLVRGGSAAGALLTRAEGAELVVVGSRGVGGFRGMLLGSLAHQVAQHAPCTAVIVPPAEGA